MTSIQKMSPARKGTLCGLVAAVCYGLIPTFTLPIKAATADQMPDASILFYRFALATLIIGGIMLLRRQSFRITRGQLVTLMYLAFLSDGAALFLIEGYNYMDSGVATTLHFMYPVMTALIMMAFYHEARKLSTLLAVGMAVGGVAVLSWPGGADGTEWRGVVIELISALCYAFYIIRVGRSRVRDMNGLKLTFYVMALGSLIFAADAFRQQQLQPITTSLQLVDLLSLAVVCTVVTNLCLVVSVKRIGSTMTSILGALEPLTAVALGCLLFSEPLTWNVVTGILLIIPAVIIIIITRGRNGGS